MAAIHKIVDAALVISDASPIMTLQRVGRLDLLAKFNIQIHIVDQVYWEVTKPENDPAGAIKATLHRLGNQVLIVETLTGLGFQAKRAKDVTTASRNIGEFAVNEYAVTLARTCGPAFVPLVFYEDPDMEELPVAKLKNVHMLNTVAFLTALHRAGVLPEGPDLVAQINALRKTPMRPIDEPGRTKKIRSTWIRKSAKK